MTVLLNPFRFGGGGGGGGALTPVSLTDNFNDSSKSASWNATTMAPTFRGIAGYTLAGSIAETTVLTINGFTPSTNQYNGYSSASTLNMATGQTIWVKATVTGHITAVLAVQTGASYYCSVEIDGFNGFIYAGNNSSGSGNTFWGSGGSVAYNSTNHAWIGIRNSGTQWQVLTAPDSAGLPGTWTQQAESTAGWAAPSAANVGVWAVSERASPGSVVFDNFCIQS